MKRVKTAAMSAILLAALSAAVSPIHASPTKRESAENQTASKVVTYKINGMVTANCPVLVRAAVKREKGVLSVSADLKSKTATVTFNAGVTNAKTIQKTVKDKTGFVADIVRITDSKKAK